MRAAPRSGCESKQRFWRRLYNAAVRFLTRRIWRAFSELDPYSDDECRLFVRIARTRAPWRWMHRFVIALLLILGIPAIGALNLFLFDSGPSRLTPRSDLFGVVLASFGILTAFGLPAVAALLARDWFLRRRLRHVLRDTGSCPQCSYSLVGLVIPQSLTIACPECGFTCTVDASLSSLARDGAAIGDGLRVVMARPPFWTRERRRRWVRNAIIATALVLLIIGVPAALYEASIRAQAALALREMPTAAAATALIRRHRPEVPLVRWPVVHDLIEDFGARVDTIEQNVGGSDRRSNVFADYALVLMAEEDRAQSEVERVLEDERRELALSALAAMEQEGLLKDMAGIAKAPVQVRDLGIPPAQSVSVALPYLSMARNQARIMSARMLLAIERGDVPVAEESLAALVGLRRACGEQPFLIEVLVSWSIDALTIDRLKRWLASTPSAEELDAIERAWREYDPYDSARSAIDFEAMWQVGVIAEIISNPSTMRFAPVLGIKVPLLSRRRSQLKSRETWVDNRDAVEAWRRFTLANLATPPFDAAAMAALPAPPTFRHASLAKALASPVDRFVLACHETAANHCTMQALIALERWRIEHGAYPESLAELVPSILPSVPIDPWTGQTLRYRRVDPSRDELGRGFLLYSVGRDGRDDGGAGATPTEHPSSLQGREPGAVSGSDIQLNRAVPIPRTPRAAPVPRK